MSAAPHVSMEDVARHAGVSIATVSRTLRGKPNVADHTRGRVLRAAAELSYVVSPLASGLATGRTGAIGVIVPYASRWYFAQVVSGAETVLREHGLDLILHSLGDRTARNRFFERQPLRRRVDGVITIAVPFTADELTTLHSLNVPIVMIGGDGGPGVTSVRVDETDAVGQAMRHLIGLGHRRIGMLSTYADQAMWLPVAHERRSSYLAALHAAGLPVDPDLVISVPFSVSDGERGTAALLRLDPPPTAVLAESDELAFGALTAIRRAGISVPRQMSVIGIDDHDISCMLDLTTVRQAVAEQGKIAAHLLVTDICGAGCPEPDRHRAVSGHGAVNEHHAASGTDRVVIPTELVVRGTTGPAPAIPSPRRPGHPAEPAASAEAQRTISARAGRQSVS